MTNSKEPMDDTGTAPTDRRGFLKAAGAAGAGAVAVAGAAQFNLSTRPASTSAGGVELCAPAPNSSTKPGPLNQAGPERAWLGKAGAARAPA
jgi:hypothetical protein